MEDGGGGGIALPSFLRRTVVKREPAVAAPDERPSASKKAKAPKRSGVPIVSKPIFKKPAAQQEEEVSLPSVSAAAAVSLPAVAREVPRSLIEKLSTFDKGEKSRASAAERMAVLTTRVKRSQSKVDQTKEEVPEVVDDRLLTDTVGRTTHVYEAHSRYTGDARAAAAPAATTTAVAPVSMQIVNSSDSDNDDDDDDDDDDEDDDEHGKNWNGPEQGDELEEEDIYIDEEEANLLSGPDGFQRQLLLPVNVEPDIEGAQKIETFKELAAADGATKQFAQNMHNIRGKELNLFVEVDGDESRYDYVSKVLEPKMHTYQLASFAIKNGMKIPVLPRMTKAEIRDARYAPDPEKGERPCVYGKQCTSYLLAEKRKKRQPEKYAGLNPFPCKEFLFGSRGDRGREAIVEGLVPTGDEAAAAVDLNNPPVPDQKMCVMCHESVVTAFYKQYAQGLLKKIPVHILHGYQVITNIPGQYPINKCLMGNTKFVGVAAPFLRYCEDNYEWEPIRAAPPVVTSGIATVAAAAVPLHQQKQPIQHWTELPCLDFQ